MKFKCKFLHESLNTLNNEHIFTAQLNTLISNLADFMKSLLIPALLAFSLLYSLPSFAQLTDSTTTNSPIIHDKLTLQIYTSNVVAKGQLHLDIDYSLEQYSGYY